MKLYFHIPVFAALLAFCLTPVMADPPAAPATPPANNDKPDAGPIRPDLAAKVDQDSVVMDDATEADITAALRYLAGKQAPNGSWSVDNQKRQAVAITSYCLIAFMAAGNLPNEGQFGKNVAMGEQFLVDSERPDGLINAGSNEQPMYGHGIGTIAMAELYGQTKDPKIKTKLEAAVGLIVKCQNPHNGGWRYQPMIMDGDISVTVLQVVALRAAKNAGIDVPQETIDRAVAFVKSCHCGDGGFSYQQGGNGGSGYARTSAAIYSLQVCGLYDDPFITPGSKYLLKKLDALSGGKGGPPDHFTYGSFYAAPAQYMIGGDTWKQWYEANNKILRSKIKREGEAAYWDGVDGGEGAGRNYSTAVYTMILALPYHYLPLYQR